MTKNKSSLKKNLLQEYISKTHKEINLSASKTLKPLYDNTDIISVDDNIHPVLIVMAGDILGGNHETLVGMAASYKIAGLTVKTMQCGETLPLNIFDIGKTIPIVQNIFASMPLVNSAIGSYIECIGKNMNMQCNEVSFGYGVAMNIGANYANATKSSILRNIGINIGNIVQSIDKDENYKIANELVRQLPNNRHRKRLSEYIKSIYTEHKSISDSSKQHTIPQTKPNHIDTNQATLINSTTTNTKEDFEKTIKELSEKVPEVTNTITFSVDNDTETVNKNKERKTKQIQNEQIDEVKFNVGDE